MVIFSLFEPLRACAARVMGSWVCVSISQHLTSRTFFCLANDTTYLTGNKGQNICVVLSKNASLQRSRASGIVRLRA